MHITPLYAALLALLFIFLSVRTLLLRKKLQIAVGDAGDKSMIRAMRVHANFAEYTPLALVLALMLELAGAYPVLVHVVCACLLVGRISHAYGVSQVKEDFRFRVTGMYLTFASIAGSAVSLLAIQGARLIS